MRTGMEKASSGVCNEMHLCQGCSSPAGLREPAYITETLRDPFREISWKYFVFLLHRSLYCGVDQRAL